MSRLCLGPVVCLFTHLFLSGPITICMGTTSRMSLLKQGKSHNTNIAEVYVHTDTLLYTHTHTHIYIYILLCVRQYCETVVISFNYLATGNTLLCDHIFELTK